MPKFKVTIPFLVTAEDETEAGVIANEFANSALEVEDTDGDARVGFFDEDNTVESIEELDEDNAGEESEEGSEEGSEDGDTPPAGEVE